MLCYSGGTFASQIQGYGLNSHLHFFCGVLPVLQGFSLSSSVSSSQCKGMYCRLISISKLSEVFEWVSECWCVILPAGGVAAHTGRFSIVYPESPGVISRFPVTLYRLSSTENRWNYNMLQNTELLQ